MSASDAQMELEQQQLLIEQLKALVRDRDDALQKKEKELQETNSKLSKARLQAKAKVVKKHAQAQDGKKEVEDSQKEMTPDDGSSHDDGAISQQSARAKTLLFKRKLEEKDRLVAEKEEIIRVREGQLEAKERVLAERDVLVNDLTEQLEEKTKAMEKMQGVPGGLGDDKGQVQEMYAQMVYKDRKIMELNAKILEQDKRVMDLQEFAGEKDQVIRGRNKVVEVLQNSIKEKEQAFQDQALLISKLTSRVETTNEKVDEVTEQLRHREQELKSETERFHIKLTESQKYFEEMLKDMDDETKRLRAAIEVKDRELEVRENDLRELISKHERDIETIMNKGNVNRQDHVVQMLENKLRDTNDVLEGKIKVITILQKESAEKEHELTESRDTMRMLKEKLQVMSEQMMLLQANFVDMETQWKEEKIRLENRMKDTAEKHETELSEKDLHLQTLQSTLSQYEAAYNQALEQYSRLQEHYQQAVAGHIDPEHITQVASSLVSSKDQQSEIDRLKNELEDSQRTISQLSLQVKEFESTPKAAVVVEESASKGDTKLLKMKAQMTSKIKSLEKELQELRENSQVTDEAASLKHRVTELEKENMDLHAKLVDFDDNKATLVELRAQIDELQMVVDTVHDQKADLLKELTAANDERLKFKQVVTDLQASRDLQDQSDRVSSQSMEIEALQGDLQTAANRITELEGSKGELELKLAQLQDQKDALEKEKAELLQEIETWKDKAEHERQSSLTLEKEHEELKLEISELTQSLLREQTITKEQKDEINQLLSQLGNLEGQLNEAHKCLNEAKENLKHTEEQKVDVNAALGATTGKAAKLREQVTLLKEEKLLWDEQITTLKSELAAGHSELNSTTEKATNLQEQVAFLKEENVQLQEQITTMKSELSASQTELEATSVQLEALKAEFGGEIEQLRTKNKMLVDELSEKAASLEKVTSEVKTVKNESLVLQSSLMESRAYSQELELQVKQLVREIDMTKEGQNEQGKEYTDKLQTLLTQLTELENELSAQQKHSSEQQELIAELSGNLDRKENEVKSVYESFKDLNQSLGAVQLELSERDGELKAALESLELEKTAKLKLEEHVAVISGELTHLKDTLSAREQSIKSLEEDKNSSIELTNSALASVKSELESVLEKNSELKSLLECKDSELLTSRQSYDELQDQVAALSSELETSKASVAELLASNEALQAKVASYQDKLAVTLQSFDEDLKHAQHLTESLQEEKESSKQLIASLEQQLTSLKIELEETLSTSAKKDAQISVLSVALSDQENHQDSLQAASLKLQAEKEQLNQQDANENLGKLENEKKVLEVDIAQLQSQVEEKTKEVCKLQADVVCLQQDLHDKEESVSVLQEDNVRLQNELENSQRLLQSDLNSKDEELQLNQVKYDNMILELQSQISHYSVELQHANENLGKLENEKKVLEVDIAQLQSQVEEKTKEVCKLQADTVCLQQDLHDKEGSVSVLQEESVRLQNELENSQKLLQTGSVRLQNELESSQMLRSENVRLQNELENLQRLLQSDLKSRDEEFQLNQAKYDNMILELQSQISHYSVELQHANENLGKLENEKKVLEVDIAQLQTQVEEKTKEVCQLQAEAVCLQQDLHSKEESVSVLQEESVRLQNELENSQKLLQTESVRLQNELESSQMLRSENVRLQNELENSQRLLQSDLKSKHEELQLNQAKYDNMILELRSQISHYSVELQHANENLGELESEKKALQVDIAQLQTQVEEKTKEICQLQADTVSLQQDLHGKEGSLSVLQEESVRLQNEVQSSQTLLQTETLKAEESIRSNLEEINSLKNALSEKYDAVLQTDSKCSMLASLIEEQCEKLFSVESQFLIMERKLADTTASKKDQLAEVETRLKLSEEEKAKLIELSSEAEIESSRLRQHIMELECQLEAKGAELNNLRFQYNSVNDSYLELTTELKDLKTILQEHKKSHIDSEKAIAALENLHQEKEARVRELSTQLESSHQHVEAVQSELGESISEITRRGAAIRDLESEIHILIGAKGAAEAEIKTMKETCRELQMMVDILKEEKQNNDQTLSRNLEKVNTALFEERTKSGKMQKGLRELKNSMQKMVRERQQLEESLSKKIENIQATLSHQKCEYENLSASIGHCKAVQENMKTSVEAQNTQTADMKAQMQGIHVSVNEKLSVYTELSSDVSQLAEETRSYKHSLNAVHEDFSQIQKSSGLYQELLTDLQNRVQTQVEEKQSFQKAFDELNVSTDSLRSLLGSSKEDLENEVRKHTDLTKELADSCEVQKRLQDDLLDVTSQLREMLQVVSKAEARLEEQVSLSEQLSTDLETLSSQQAVNQSQIVQEKVELEAAYSKLQEEQSQEKELNMRMNEELCKVTEEYRQLKDSFEAVSRELQELKGKFVQEKDELVAAYSKLLEEQSQEKELNVRINEEMCKVTEEYGQLKDSFEAVSRELQECKISSAEERHTLEETKTRLHETTHAYQALKTEMCIVKETMSQSVNETAMQVTEKTTEIADLHTLIKLKEDEISQLKVLLEEVQESMHDKECQIEAVSCMCTDAEEKAAVLDASLSSLLKEKVSLSSTLVLLQNRIEDLSQENEELEMKASEVSLDIKSKTEEFERKLTEQISLHSALAEEKNLLQLSFDDMSDRLQNERSLVSNLTFEKECLFSLKTDLQNSVLELTNTHLDLRREVEDLQNRVDMYLREKDDLQQRYNDTLEEVLRVKARLDVELVRYENLDLKVQEAEQELKNLLTDKQRNEETIKALELQLADELLERKILDEQLQVISTEKTSYIEIQETKRQSEFQELTERYARIVEEVDISKSAISELQQVNTILEQVVQDLKDKLATTESEFLIYKDNSDGLLKHRVMEIEVLTSEISALRTDNEAMLTVHRKLMEENNLNKRRLHMMSISAADEQDKLQDMLQTMTGSLDVFESCLSAAGDDSQLKQDMEATEVLPDMQNGQLGEDSDEIVTSTPKSQYTANLAHTALNEHNSTDEYDGSPTSVRVITESFKTKLNQVRKSFSCLLSEKAALESEQKHLVSLLDETVAEHESTESVLQESRSACEALQEEVADMAGELQNLHTVVAKKEINTDMIHEVQLTFEKNIQELRSSMQELSHEKEMETQGKVFIMEMLSEAEERCQSLDAEFNRWKIVHGKECKALQEALQISEKLCSEQEVELSSTRDQFQNELQAARKQFEDELGLARETFDDTTKTLKATVEELHISKEQLDRHIQELETSNKALEMEIDSVRRQRDKDVRDIQELLKQSEVEYQTLEQEVCNLKSEKSTSEAERLKLCQQLENFIESSKSEMDNFACNKTLLENQAQTLMADLSTANEANLVLQNTLRQAEQELSEVRQELLDNKSLMTESEMQLSALTALVASLKETLALKEKEIEDQVLRIKDLEVIQLKQEASLDNLTTQVAELKVSVPAIDSPFPSQFIPHSSSHDSLSNPFSVCSVDNVMVRADIQSLQASFPQVASSQSAGDSPVVSSLQEELKHAEESQTNKTAEKLQQLSSEVENLKAELCVQESTISRLEADLQSEQKARIDLEQTLKKKEKLIQGLQLKSKKMAREELKHAQEEPKHAEESQTNKTAEKLQQLSREVENLKAELCVQESTISRLEADLQSEQKARIDLEQTLKKKEKLIQGLQLKSKKTAKQFRQQQDMQLSLTESQLKQKEDSFYSASWSESSVDTSGMSESERLYRQLLSQYQGVVIERDTLKELISEKDIEIIKLQTQYFDADLHWKEVAGELQKQLDMLKEKLNKEGVIANALQRKEQMLEEELQVTTSELMSTSHLLNESIQSGLTEADMVSQLRLKFLEARDLNVEFENKMSELSVVLQEKTSSLDKLQEQLRAKDNEIQSLQEDLEKKIIVKDDEIDRLQFQVRNLESQTRSLKENIKILEIERQGRSSHIDMYASKVQELEMTLKQVTSEAEDVKSVLTEKDKKIVVMEDVMKEMYGTQDTYSTSVASLTFELKAAKTEAEQMKAEKEEMQKTLKKKDAKIVALTKRIGSSTPKKQEPLPALSESFVAKEGDQSNEKGVISVDVSCADSDNSLFGSELTHQQEVATLTAEVAGLRKLLKKKDAEILAANKKLKGLQMLQGKMSSAASIDSVTEASGRMSVMSQFDSRSTTISDDVQELNDRLRQSELSRDAMEVQIRELEVEVDNCREQILNMRHELEDLQEELHFVSRDKQALENCVFDIRDMVNPQAVEQFAGDDTLYSTAESVRLLVEEKFMAEKLPADLQSWLDKTDQDYERNSNLKSTVQSLELELKSMNGKYSDTLNQLQQAIKEKSVLEEQLHVLKSNTDQREDVELESKLREASVIIRCMKQELESLKAERDSLQERLNVVDKSHIQQTNVDEHSFQYEIQFGSQIAPAVQVEKQEIQTHPEAFTEHIDSSQEVQRNAEEQLRLGDTYEFYINKTKELSSKLLDVEQSRTELENKLQHQVELNAVFQSEIEALHHAAETCKQEKDFQSASLSSELAECKTRVSDLRTMLKNKETKLSALSDEFGDLALQYEKLQHKNLKADSENLALKEEFEQQQNTLTHQAEEIQNLKDSLSYYEGITQQLQEESRGLKEQLEQYMTSWSQQEDIYKSLQEQLSYQQIVCHQKQEEHDSLDRQFKELEEACILQSDMMKNVEEDLMTKKKRIQEITEQNESLQKLLQEKDENDKLSAEYLTSMCKLCGTEDISFASLYEHLQNLVARMGVVETTESLIGSLQAELSLKAEAVAALQQQLQAQASSVEDVEKLQHEITGLRYELSMQEEAAKSSSSLDEQLFYMNQELHSRDTAVHQLQQEINDLRGERDELKQNVETQVDRVVGLESALAENRLKMEEYEQDILKYKNTIQSCEAQIYDLETQLSQNMEISAENESKLNASLSDELRRNQDLLSQCEQLNMVLQEKDSEISRLSIEIETVKRDMSVLSDQLQQSEDMVLALTHENSTIQQHFDDAQTKVLRIENHCMTLQERVDKLNHENITFRADTLGDQEFVFTPEVLEGLKSQIAELADRLQKSENTVVDITHERETLKLSNEESVEKMAKLQTDYMVLLQELEKLKAGTTLIEPSFDSKESEHSSITSKQDNLLEQKIAELEEQCTDLQKTVKKRDAKIAALSKKLDQAHLEIKQLEVKLQNLLQTQTTQSVSLEVSTQSEDSAFASQYFTSVEDFVQPDTSLSQDMPKNELPNWALSQNDATDAGHQTEQTSALLSSSEEGSASFPDADRGALIAEISRLQAWYEYLQQQVQLGEAALEQAQTEIARLKNTIGQLPHQIIIQDESTAECSASVSDLEARNTYLQQELNSSSQHVLDMTQNLQEAQLQIQAYATAVSEAQQQLLSDEEAKKDLETKVLELTTALSSVESKLQEIEEASKLTGESSKSDLSSLESQLRQMEEQLTAEQQLKVLMEDQLAQVQSDLKAEMESKITLEHLLTDSEDHKAAMEQKLLQLERSLQENIENASKSSSEYEQVIAELREKLTMSDSQIAELSHSLESVRAQNEVSNKILEQMQTSSSEKEQNTIQQLRDKAEEVVILQQQLEQSAVELNEHKTNTVKTENRIGDLEEELLSNKNELQRILSISESLQEELKSKDLKVQQLQNLSEEERVSFSQEKESLTNTIACLEAQGQELSELKQKCLAADEERQVFIEQLAIVQAELETVASLQSQVADLKSQNEMLLGGIETSSDKLTAGQGRCLELQAEKEALSSKVSELTELQEAHQATIQSLSQDKQVLEKDVTQLSETLSSYSAKISELIDSHKILEETREQLNLTQTECQKLRQLVEEKDVVLSQQVSDLLERSQLIDTLTAARDKLMEEIKIVSSTVAEKDQKIQSLLENMQEMEDRLVQLEELSNQQTPSEQQQPSQSANSDSTSAEIEALKAALAEKEKSYADKELMAKKAIATAKKLKFQLTQANKSLEDANKALDNAKTQIMELNVENTTLQTKLAVVSSEVQQSSDVVKELSQEVQKSDGHKPTELSTAESRFEEQQQTKLDTTGLAAESINTELEFSLNVSSAQSFGDVSLEVESLQAQVATYRECCEQLQQQVQDLTEASFANESKLKQKQNLIDQLEGVKEGLKLTVTEVELAYQQLQEELEKANEDYIASKEAFEKKCEILSEQAQQWKSFTDSLQQEVTVKDHRIQQMEAELHHLHSEHSESVHLKESLREKDNRLAEYSVQLESLKSVLDSESETTEELRRKLSGAEEAIETMRNSLEEKERNVAQSASLLSEMQQRVQEREAEVEALKESLEKQQVDFKATEQDLHSQVTILSDQIEDYKSRVEAVSALLENSQQTQDTMAAQSESLKQQLDQQGAYIDELNGIVDDLKAQVEESRAKLHRENAEELESVRAALVEFQQQVEDQNQVINTLEQSLSKEVKNESEAETAQKSQTSSAESLDDVNLQLLNYQTLVEELNREILALKEVKTQEIEEPLNNDAEYWKANLDQLVLEKTAVEEERNQLKSELDNQLEIARRMQEVVSEKLAQVQNLQNAYEHLQSSLSALSSEKEQLLVNIDYLKGELDGMEQVIAESQFAESKAKDEVSRLKSERDQLIIRVGKLEQELLDVRHQLHKTDSSVSQEAVVTAEKSVKWSDQIVMEKSAIAVEHLQQAADTHPQGTVAQKESLELSLKLETAKENLKQVQGQYEKTKSRLQVAEVKCEKMLVKLKSFKDKNDKLQIQVDELQQKLGLQEGSPKRDSNPREERRRLEEQVTSLNNRLRDVETHNGRLIHDNSTLKEQLKSVEATYSKDRFDEVTTALSRVQSELEDRNAALEFAKSQAQDLQQTVDHLRAELQLKSDEVDHLKAELVHQADSDDMILNEKLMRFQVLLKEKTAEISELKRQLAEEEELQLALNDQVARLQHELELSKKDAEASLISELSKLREVMSKELSTLQNELTVKNNESVMLAQERDSELKLNESLNEKLKHMVQEIARLNEELSSEKFRASKAEKEVLDLQQRLSEELKLKDVAEQEKEDLRMTELNSLKNQLETLQFQYDSLSQDNAHYQSLTTSLTTNSSALKREIEELRFKLKKSDEQHQDGAADVGIGKDVFVLTQRLKDTERERDELSEEFEGVREELVSLRREKTALTQQVGDLSNTVQQLHNQISSLQASRAVGEEGAVVAAVKSEQTRVSNKDAFSREQIDVLEGELTDLRDELVTALDTNQQLRHEISGLSWKLEEASNLEQEVEDLQSELSSSAMEKKILSHDLEEVRGEMSALQTDKHLLMKEVERLSELLENQDFHEKDAGDSKTVAALPSIGEEMLQVITAKDSEITEIQGILDLRTDQLTASLKDITAKDKLLIERNHEILALKDELGQLDHVLKDNEDLDQKIAALVEELRAAQVENEALRKKFDNFNQKIDSVKSLEADFDSLNADFNKVLEEKSSMAREIDELHIKIRDLMSLHYETTFTAEQQQHVLREKETLQRRVEELEGTEGSEMEENARLKRELDKISASLQQAEFDNKSLISQLQLAKTEGMSESESHADHKRLQAQFTDVLEQKNAVVNQLNDALHTLKQREARCQQLAMQVSQLAEDRGYLNTQLANISKSLREKEQEWLAMRHQYGDLYQAYIGAQSKNAELERRIALDSVQKELEDEETAAEADQIRGENDQSVKQLEDLQAMYQTLQDSYTSVSTTLIREKTLREQLERELGDAHEQVKLLAAITNQEVHIELDDDSDPRIRETTTMLTRHGFGYCSRVQSWLKVKNRQLGRVMRLRPGLRTVIWIYFAFLHIMLIACFGGFL